ncbi:hypothetical protein GGI04_003982 [Coemansia thaxteri]|uniref:G-protein coupled receptors family 3 profile domain-containing protein n=1 Tax=Coemansia thaxteri TaxID=2663907 RepID=A0A9W8EL89_9FUNG|nr:hypothetical protein GGI04_003982 [Coemansia thaxteri]KAJ2007682.1 hypothetical protein H4R26_000640 [Coemansia thaxteri]KAJ2471777.1 hypothetical protein GGI02_002049 [Coemansia sp. RSA 2322]KAJ2485673.1 hypothetical protein EV174_001576 [Coemansia sp. RSA 2320]
MAFPNEAFEDQRLQNAIALKVELDKRGAADVATVMAFAAVVFINFLAVLFTLWNRNYPPIKAKSPLLMTCLFVGSTFWYIGDIRGHGHVQQYGTGLADCHVSNIWMHAVSGMFAVCGLYALRSQMLYQVFHLNQPCSGLKFFMPTIVYSTIVLVFAIVMQALGDKRTTYYVPQLDICSGTNTYKITILTLLWGAVLYDAVMYWRIRNIKSSFNESREMAAVSSLSILVLLVTTLISFLKPSYPLLMPFRVTMTVIGQFCVHLTWWSIMAVPIYQCLFNRHTYLVKWRATLREDGLQREYRADSSSGMQPITDNATKSLQTSYGDKVTNTHAFYYGNESGARLYAPMTYADVGAIIGHEAPSAISNSCSGESVIDSEGVGRKLV